MSDKLTEDGRGAGFAAVDMLLRSGFAGEIAMISDDMAPPYDRTLLTKDYLDGPFGDAYLPLSNRDLFSEDRIRLMLRTKIARIDPTARQGDNRRRRSTLLFQAPACHRRGQSARISQAPSCPM
jgi:hypothetical protein